MLALAEYRASLCPCGCGNYARDTLAPEGEHRWKTSRVRCHAATTLAEAKRAASAGKNPMPVEGVMWIVTKVG